MAIVSSTNRCCNIEIDEIVATFSRQFEAWVEAWGTVNYCKLRGSKTVRRRFGLCPQPWFTDPPKNMRLAHGRSQLSLFHMFHRHISSYPLLIHDPWPSLATPQTKDPNGKASPVVSLAPGHRPRTHEGEPRAAMPPLVVEQLCVIMGREPSGKLCEPSIRFNQHQVLQNILWWVAVVTPCYTPVWS